MSEHRRALDAVTGIPASAGFCEPVEGYADSPMSIAATVKAMAYEVGRLNKQLADAKEENERVRQANIHTMDVFEDMKAAKEQAEARVAELLTICQAVQRDLLLRAEPDWDGSGQKVVNLSAGFWEELNRVIGKYDDTACKSFDAVILRKQAEAVEAFISEQAPLLDRYRPGPINEKDHCCEFNLLLDRERLHSEAQRLIQKAEEAERAGGVE